ncbi:MAG: FG-GAP-like repeat-containing protein, partial [Acidimicrobiales bacterium]|nr:FG-GAP-like repeat-containing protein [Acidimicrobiales bacterium]
VSDLPSGAYVFVVEGIDRGRRFDLAGKDVVTIGREGADINLQDPFISRRHAEVRVDGRRWVISDNQSTNGSLVNDRPAGGQELLDGDDDSQTLGPITNATSVFEPAGVALAELDHQAGVEMVVSERGDAVAIHIYRKDGTELPGWPRPIANLTGTDWNWATPAVGDIDGDGDPEIVVNTLTGRTWAWHVDGTEVRDGDANPATNGVFYFRTGADYEWSMSGPALYDLDGDGAKDVIFGTRNDATGLKRLMAIKYDGTNVAGFPKTVNGAVGASPAIADLNNDGIVEIVFFTSLRYLYAIQANGANYPGVPFYYNITTDLTWVTSPGVGDLDGDGQLEIVFAANVSGLDSRLVAVDTDVAGGHSGVFLAGWPVTLPGSSEGSPIVGDIDGDG